ncbi:MAG: glycoside hydrolase family 3 protein [Treponema sp.]|uniref:glycoside hydrolase family 3 protein n=1 Tax=Treponema sp. TaxID=166 RepID=UPI003FA1D7CF
MALPVLSVQLGAQTAPLKTLPDFYDSVPAAELAARITDAMTDEELLAQTFMFGWAGQEPTNLLMDWITERSLGSIKIFGWNTEDSVELAKAVGLLQKKSNSTRFRIPLFVATDQEGGWIRHVKGLTSETPGNLAIGASGYPIDAYYEGFYIARELSVLGINLNFAPTVDLYTNHESSIIGPRSFGQSPEAAGILARAFMQGSRKAGVLTTAKHFPGHGDTALDSHGKLPSIAISQETLYNRELIPFQYLIESGVPAIMTGHLHFPAVSEHGEPATFSRYLLQTVLRGQLGFKGLVITDDMMMYGAIRYAGAVDKAVQLALEAGNDIIESSTTPRLYDAFWTENLKRMQTTPAFRLRVKDAAYRIIETKLRYFKSGNAVPLYPDVYTVADKLPDAEGQAFFLSLAARAVTIVRNKYIPYTAKPSEKILLAGGYSAFLQAGLKRFPGAKTSNLSDGLLSKAAASDTIIFCLANDSSLQLLQQLYKAYPRKKYIIFSCLSPVFLSGIPEIPTAIALYSYAPVSFTAGFAALLGDYTPQGKLPLDGIN